jgi:fumarate hydratase class II
MGDALLESAHLLATTCTRFATKLVAGLEADEERCRRYAERTPALATVLGPLIGYERATEVVEEALATDRSVRDVALERAYASAEELDRVMDPSNMI